MTDWKQVNVRVRQDEYGEWDEYANEQYGGMTDLVRTAVRRELNGQYTGESGGESGSDSAIAQEVAEAVDALENTVNDMDNRLSVVRQTVESSGPEFSFQAAVRETLRGTDGLPPSQIAARLDANVGKVREALREMEGEDTYPAEDTPEGEETRWNLFGGA